MAAWNLFSWCINRVDYTLYLQIHCTTYILSALLDPMLFITFYHPYYLLEDMYSTTSSCRREISKLMPHGRLFLKHFVVIYWILFCLFYLQTSVWIFGTLVCVHCAFHASQGSMMYYNTNLSVCCFLWLLISQTF